jgi:transposase
MMRHRHDLPTAIPGAWAALIPPDSFYARLAAHRDELVTDDDYAALYKDSPKGRPSLPPSLVVLTMLLQYHDDCSDAEAEARVRFDLRWKHALGLPLEDVGFDATVLCHFRRKLLAHGLERALFDRLVTAAREAGLIAKAAAQVIDSSHVLGAAGVRDTYALIRGGIRKLLRALGYAASTRGRLPERLAWYLDPAAPEKPDLDWDDAAARAAHLGDLMADARAALALAGPEPASRPAVGEAAALLTKIVADDVTTAPPLPPAEPKRPGRPRRQPPADPAGDDSAPPDAPPRLRQGVAPDRTLSVRDPEMRVGHKSARQQWAGYKVQVAEEPRSELLTAVEVRPANEHDAAAAVELITGQAERVGLQPGAVLGDGAYGTADVRAELGAVGVEVVAKLRASADGERFGKEAFGIDLAANDGRGSVTCPAGETTTVYRMARDSRHRPVQLFRFPLAVCSACPLRERCLGERTAQPLRRPAGRQVQLHYHEATLQAARAAQRTPAQRQALKERLRPRARVERKIAELLRRHGLRQGRYLGRAKTLLQAAMTAAMVNAKRLLALAAADEETAAALRAALVAGVGGLAVHLQTLSRVSAGSLTVCRQAVRRWMVAPLPPGLGWAPTKSAAS